MLHKYNETMWLKEKEGGKFFNELKKFTYNFHSVPDQFYYYMNDNNTE